jgi:hypothetical protein
MGACIHAAGPLPDEKSKPLFPIFENGKYGYIDQAGKVAIKPQFDMAKRFSEGLARVKVGDKWGFIDQTGKMLIQPQFDSDPYDHGNDSRNDFHEGMAAVTLDKGRKWGYIDKKGKMIIAPEYGLAESFSEGMATVYLEYPVFLIRTGSPTPVLHSWYIDEKGSRLKFQIVGETFSEGLAVADRGRDESRKEGYIDKTGQFRIEPQFSIARSFHEGLACVRPGNTNDYGYIDKTGKMVISLPHVPGDSGPGDFSEGLALMQGRVSGEFGFIGKTGAFAIEPRFWMAGRFSDGVAGACVEDKTANSGEGGVTCGYIDRTGQWIIQWFIKAADFGAMSDFYEGLALVCGKDFCGYINKKGQYVWRSTEILENQHFDPTSLVGCTLWNWPNPEYGKDYCRN